MEFKQAYQEMLKGKKIKRPGWGGYWFIEDEKVKIKLKTGEIIENDFNQETITNTLAEDWEIVEEKEEKIWWEPEIRGNYYLINGTGHISCNPYDDDDTDKRCLSLGNCFQTEEQAKFMAEKLKVIAKIRKCIAKKGQIEPHVIATRYYIYYNPLLKEARVGVLQGGCGISSPFNLYFHSNQDAEECVKLIGKENLKKYYFGVKDE